MFGARASSATDTSPATQTLKQDSDSRIFIVTLQRRNEATWPQSCEALVSRSASRRQSKELPRLAERLCASVALIDSAMARHHALNATTPLLDEVQSVEGAADHAMTRPASSESVQDFVRNRWMAGPGIRIRRLQRGLLVLAVLKNPVIET